MKRASAPFQIHLFKQTLGDAEARISRQFWQWSALGLTPLALVLVPLTIQSVRWLKAASLRQEAEANSELARLRAAEMDRLFGALVEKSRALASLSVSEHERSAGGETSSVAWLVREDQEIASLELYQKKDGKPLLLKRYINEKYLQTYDLDASYIPLIHEYHSARFPLLQTAFAGATDVRNLSNPEGMPMLSKAYPLTAMAPPSGIQ